MSEHKDSHLEPHVLRNLADMARRGAAIEAIIDAACEGKSKLSSEDVKEIMELVQPYAKHFTTYSW